MRVEHKTIIKRPPGEVFAYVTCYENDPVWLNTITESVKTSEGPVGIGTRLQRVGRMLGRPLATTAEIIEYVPGLKSCFKSLSGPLPQVETRSCEQVEEGTCFTFCVEGNPGRLFHLSEASLARIIRRQVEADVNNLKEILETYYEIESWS